MSNISFKLRSGRWPEGTWSQDTRRAPCHHQASGYGAKAAVCELGVHNALWRMDPRRELGTTDPSLFGWYGAGVSMSPHVATGHCCHVGQPLNMALCTQRLSRTSSADASHHHWWCCHQLKLSNALAAAPPLRGALSRRATRQPSGVRRSVQRLEDIRQGSIPLSPCRKTRL